MSVNISHKESLSNTDSDNTIDIFSIHEQRAGRLVLDPAEAREEFGNEIASKLKLTKDGLLVLWPQPSDDPEDPQNWSDRKKGFQLFIIVLAAIVGDFNSAIGIPSVFALARQYHTSSAEINDLTSTWSIFLIGWGGIPAVMLMRRYGRLSTLFWTQLLALIFMAGATFAPTLKVFAAMRCLTAFFATCPQVSGLFTITDLYPFHLQARMINIWTMAVVISSHLPPFLFGFLVARASWRWAYGIGTLYTLVVFILIVLFTEESLYFRQEGKVSIRQTGLRSRIKALIGITGFQSVRKDPTWTEVLTAPLRVVWRPHLFSILVLEAVVFGFALGITVTNTLFLQMPPPFGFGLSPTIVSGVYAGPVVAIFIGELLGRYLNDWFMNQGIRRNKGVFEAEERLWTCYIGMPLYLAGFVVLGVALQNRLNIAAVIIGWGLVEVGRLVTGVAMYAYCADCFPRQYGEIATFLNLVRTLGGFSVAFFQVSWAKKHGALQTFGCEAAIAFGLFLLIVPLLQLKGRYLRARFCVR